MISTAIHAGLRQMGKDGLLRLKEWIECDRPLYFGGETVSVAGVP